MKDWTVGAIETHTGITVRTLHHYDEIGLLTPSGRTEAGYRLYSDEDLHRLELVVMLRSVGLSLAEIAEAFAGTPADIEQLLTAQSAAMRGKAAEAAQIADRIDRMVEHLHGHSVASTHEALETINAVRMFEKYFDADQLNDLRHHARELGADVIREAEAEWPRLIAAVRFEMASGTPPDDPRVQPLTARWKELLEAFTKGRFDLAAGAGRLMHHEPSVRRRVGAMGLDAAVMEYVARASASSRAPEST